MLQIVHRVNFGFLLKQARLKRAEKSPSSALVHISWARLLKRVFYIDLEHCPNCYGPLTIIAAILDPTAIAKILSHLGLSARAPSRPPARHVALLQTA